ncbi:hypothetical protein BH09ACT6_BH09ACT6_00670 [soil metagenome]
MKISAKAPVGAFFRVPRSMSPEAMHATPTRTHPMRHPRLRRRSLLRWVAALGITSALAAGVVAIPNAALASPGDSPTVTAMARLWIADWASDGPEWTAFVRQLAEAKKIGITGISVDVWWGKVALSPTSYTWAYYDKEFKAISDAGLAIVPIMSTHECGGGPGDDGDCKTKIGVPGFVWEPVNYGEVVGVLPADTFYQSEYGNVSHAAIAPWGMASARAFSYIKGFMNAFEDHYTSGSTDYRGKISEIAISAGPTGELREPSYDYQDATVPGAPGVFPNRGVLQTYSPAARAWFQQWVLTKYGSVAGAASAWGIPGLTLDTITPPNDHDRFFTSGSYLNIQYGKDFTQWNNESLVDHGRRMLDTAIEAFDEGFSTVALSEKIPGVHWQSMTSSPIKRAAEIAAGLVSSNVDVASPATGHGYNAIITMIHDVDVNGDGVLPRTHHVLLHFTELEKPNKLWDGGKLAYSAAADQVGWVADAASADGVELKGENALNGGLHSDGDADNDGWSHIRSAFDRDPVRRFYGLTLLRLPDIANGGFSESLAADFIRDYK